MEWLGVALKVIEVIVIALTCVAFIFGLGKLLGAHLQSVKAREERMNGQDEAIKKQGQAIEELKEKTNDHEVKIARFDERLARIPIIEEKLDKALGLID